MVNDVGFMISEEDLASGPGLLTQELLYSRVLLKYEKGQKASDIDFRRGTESAPLLVLASCFMSVRKLLIR